jgi:hypothetical protein
MEVDGKLLSHGGGGGRWQIRWIIVGQMCFIKAGNSFRTRSKPVNKFVGYL